MPKKVHKRANELIEKGLPEDVAWGRAYNEAKRKRKRKKKERR